MTGMKREDVKVRNLQPWTIGWDLNWNEGGEMDEAICQENNRFLEHYENLKIEGAQ